MSEQLMLNKFNMRQIPIYDKYGESDGKIIVFTGGRGSGKSRLVIDFLHHHSDVPYVICFSPTESLTDTFSPHVPQVFINYEYSSKKLRNVLNRQKIFIDKIKHDPNYKHADPRVIVILDDCLKDDTWIKDHVMREIFFNGRHFRITVLITMQYVLGIPPTMRSNIDYVFMMFDSRKTNLKKLHENYASVIETYGTFRKIFNICTQDFRTMVIDFGMKSSSMVDSVYWYKSKLKHEFRMCPKELWKFNDIIYKRRKEEEYEQMKNENEEELMTKRNKSNVILMRS